MPAEAASPDGFRRVPRSYQTQYDPSMSDGKVRKTLTLDPDIVEVLGADPAALSATVNALLREEVERRKRRENLRELVEELEAYYGAPDPEDVAAAERLFDEIDREFDGKVTQRTPFLQIAPDDDGKTLVLRADPSAEP